jgi:hypothetical protein
MNTDTKITQELFGDKAIQCLGRDGTGRFMITRNTEISL